MHDPPSSASHAVREYWSHLEHMPFYEDLELELPNDTCPITWHCDGVKIYKTHKAWVYSFASAVRKGPSLNTKLLFMIFRENEQVKPDTHRCIAKIIGWVMKVLMTGKYPTRNHKGELYPPDSVEAGRSGERFAGNWRFAFGAFKADLEARVQVHQLARNWQSDSICEHCLANKLPNQMVYTNFSDRAGYMEYMLSHKEFLLLNPPNKQSAWVDVPGWAKDRNVEVPCYRFKTRFSFRCGATCSWNMVLVCSWFITGPLSKHLRI